MKVKDVSVLFDNLCGFDYRVISDFYDEDGFYIGQVNKNYVNGELFVSDKLRTFWESKNIKGIYGSEYNYFTFIVLKGEEK